MEKLISRLVQVLRYKKVSISQADTLLDVGNGYIGKQLKKNGSVNSDIVELFLKTYSDVNAEWLLTGKGDMIKGTAQLEEEGSNLTEEQKLKRSNERLEEMLHINMQNTKKLMEYKDKQIAELENEIVAIKSKSKPTSVK